MIRNTVVVAVAIAVSPACGDFRDSASSDTGTSLVPGAMKQQLEQLLAGTTSMDELELEYDDMHSFHGGETLTVKGDTLRTRHLLRDGIDRQQIEPPPANLTSDQLRTLVALLLEIEAWEQRVPPREAVPDESAAVLNMRIGPVESSIWEWYNDLNGNNRMVRVKHMLEEIAGPAPTG